MARLFGRLVQVVVGGRVYSDHEVVFTCEASLTSDPNTATIDIYNLPETERNTLLSYERNTQVGVRAGYLETSAEDVFLGRTRRTTVKREGPDVIVSIEASSAFKAREFGTRLDKAYRKGTAISTVLNDLIGTLGLQRGNLDDVLGQINLGESTSKFEKPFAVSGPAWESLEKVLKSSGFEVTTEGDALQVVGLRNAMRRTAVKVNAKTGLIGVPSVDEQGVMTANTLMIPRVFPGRLIVLNSEFVNGEFKIRKTTHSGSLYGSEFGIAIEAKVLKR